SSSVRHLSAQYLLIPNAVVCGHDHLAVIALCNKEIRDSLSMPCVDRHNHIIQHQQTAVPSKGFRKGQEDTKPEAIKMALATECPWVLFCHPKTIHPQLCT